jgi:cytochrome c-type protein NapB
MKKLMKMGLGIATVSAMLLLTGCGAERISDTALSYRNTDLNQKGATAPKVEYLKNAAGSGVRLKRGFQDAPPMIPHDTEGMLPITKENNACLGCHLPNVAKAVKATPVPPSHFTNFRPNTSIGTGGKMVKDGQTVDNTSDRVVAKFKKLGHLYQGRFNCSQCHAPQANIEPLVKNNFQADFKQGGEFSSKLDDMSVLEGVDTTK